MSMFVLELAPMTSLTPERQPAHAQLAPSPVHEFANFFGEEGQIVQARGSPCGTGQAVMTALQGCYCSTRASQVTGAVVSFSEMHL